MNAQGKVIIVTGSNAGIGKATALSLARLGATVVMVCRNTVAGEAVRQDIITQTGNAAVDLLACDLSSQASIRSFATEFRRKYTRLDGLINNAANFDHRLKQATLTGEGVEVVFATNHLGPFLLTHLLLDMLKASAPARVLNVASKGLMIYPFLSIEFDNLNGQRRFTTQHAYYHSKLAQIMFTFDLAERLRGTGVTVNCIRVPNVQIDEGRYEYLTGWRRKAYEIKRRQAITPVQMAEAYVRLATAPEFEAVSGQYFDEHGKPVKPYRPAYDRVVRDRLWTISAELTHL
ncbi:MAG: SDR family NAD(P)-dependent oxidoreductase [Thermoflexales bacterium]|nr:SDR family NAD(P)-dependent oxidoreductase [Thermoflexales bacterium]